MSEPLLPVQDERIDADCPCACHELGVADTCLSVCCALARKDKEITDLRREVEIALEAMNARHQDALRLKARLADTEDVLWVSLELVASNRVKRLALEFDLKMWTDRWNCSPYESIVQHDTLVAKIKTLEEALRDECIGHMDNCKCRACALVFAQPAQGGEESK
jgi:hypothetical protein